MAATKVTEGNLARALAHPVRAQLFTRLQERQASPTELAREIGSPVPNVSYHVRKLEALGVIRLAEEKRRRGAVEHYFTATVRPEMLAHRVGRLTEQIVLSRPLAIACLTALEKQRDALEGTQMLSRAAQDALAVLEPLRAEVEQ